MSKICTKCKNEKDHDLFPKRSISRDGFASWCKQCFAKNAAFKFKNDPIERKRKSANRQKSLSKNRDNLYEYFLHHPCIDCGNKDIRVLEFDHKNNKTYNISEMLDGFSWNSILKEIAKCVVRCANCHKIKTQKQFKTWRFLYFKRKDN